MSPLILCDLRVPPYVPYPFDIVFADPPWWYADQRKVRKDGKTPTKGIGACHHYDQMTTDELRTLPLAPFFAKCCHLYLWATAPLLPDALHVMDAWGFSYSTVAHVWIKVNTTSWEEAQEAVWQERLFPSNGDEEARAFLNTMTFYGPGFYSASNCELLLLGTKGRPFRHAKGKKGRQVIFAPTDEEHSRKPEEAQSLIEWMYPGKRMAELFGRRERAGWTVYGNENKFPSYCKEGQ